MKNSVQKLIYKKNIGNFIFLLVAKLSQSAAIILISLMLERIMSIASTKNIDDLRQQLILFLIFLPTLIVFMFFVWIIQPKYKKRAMCQYKNNIYEYLLKKSITNFNKENTSVYLSSLTNDVNYIEENYIFSIFELISQIVLFIASVVVMLVFSPLLTLFAVLTSLIPLVACMIVGSKLEYHEKRISDQNASFLHFLKDNFIGFSTIKVFKAEKKMNELFQKNNNVLENTKAKKVKTLALLDLVQTTTTLLPQFTIFFIGAYLAITTDKIAPSVIILFVQLMNFIMNPLILIPSLYSKRRACKPLFKKINDIIADQEEEKETNDINSINEIKITNLNFKYDEKQVIDNLSYTFEKNKSYALVGTSGSGKTTLLNLLSGRSNDYEGQISYNNTDLKELSLDSLFEKSSFVEQNVFVFDDSIINNITMYSNVDEELLNEAIVKSGLSELIKEKGKDYKCGENGANLSGGEKQRISIARALIKQSQLLMLDEVTSALDNETSISITNNLLDIKDTTKIMITHRLDEAVLRRFDEIIVLKNGRIVESGNYDELMNNNYAFKSLVEISNI